MRISNRRRRAIWSCGGPAILTLTLLTLASTARGDALADAKRHLAAKQYDRVDAALADALAVDKPSLDVLQVSLQAAMADGRFLTAHRRAEAILDLHNLTDANTLHTAAHTARLAGETKREAELLSRYIKAAARNDKALPAALSRAVTIGTDPTAFDSYIKTFGADELALRRGTAMLSRLFQINDAAGFANVTRTLLANCDGHAEEMRLIHEELRKATDAGLFFSLPGSPLDGSAKPTKPSDDYRRYSTSAELLMPHAGQNHELTWYYIERSGQASPPVMLKLLAQSPPMPGHIVQRVRSARSWHEWDGYDQAHAGRLLAIEKSFRDVEDRNAHREIVALLGQLSGKLKEHITLARIEPAIQSLAARYKDSPDDVRYSVGGIVGYAKTTDEVAALAGKHRRFLDPRSLRGQIDHLTREAPAEDRNRLIAAVLGDDPRAWHDADAFSYITDKAMAKQLLRRLLKEHAGNLDHGRIARALADKQRFEPAEVAAMLDEHYKLAGYSQLFRDVIAQLRNDKAFTNDAAFKDLLKSADKTRVGSDPALWAFGQIYSMPDRGGKQAKQAHNVMQDALNRYGGAFPANKPTDQAMRQAIERYVDICDDNKGVSVVATEILLGKLGKGAPWRVASRVAARSNDTALRARFVAEAIKAGADLSQLDGSVFRAVTSDGKYVLTGHYDKVRPSDAWYSIKTQTESSKDWKAGIAEVAQFLAKAEPIEDQTINDTTYFTTQWYQRAQITEPNAAILDQLERRVIKPRREAHGALSRAFEHFNHVGQFDRALKDYRAQVASLKGRDRVNGLFRLLDYSDDQSRYKLIVEELMPQLEALSATELQGVELSNTLVQYTFNAAHRGQGPEELRDKLKTAQSKLAGFIAQGAGLRRLGRGEHMNFLLDGVTTALEAGEYEQTLQLVEATVRYCSLDRSRDALGKLRDSGRWELLFIATRQVPDDDKQLAGLAQQLRGIAAAKIPGMYPVPATHPAFPVYVASGELARGNEDRAWALLLDNVAEFEKTPLQFDLEFVVWSLNRFRVVKGENDVLLNKARTICDLILAEEENLDRDFVAAVTLSRADIFREMGNPEAAELEYKSLLADPRLQKTPSGRQARYRLVDLMIARGNSPAAMEQIELWLTYPDPALHTQAYYFKALIAYEDEDYKLCREMLNNVFEREFGHEQARLLEGEWRKMTRSLEDTDVYPGRPVEMTLIKPGQELKISIHDKNLSVIGSGSFIPVIVKTSDGKDRERASLYPVPRTPNLFRAKLGTRLGEARPGNLIVEVNGKDEISYEVDPQFLRDRGLSTMPAKTLRVVDDGWLAVSAGRVLTEEEEKDIALQRQVAAIRGEKVEKNTGNSRTVRPGNDIYIMVRDRDQDVSSNLDAVRVDLKTTSGDVLENVELSETELHTGVFRGSVPSALPLPRAYASDSADSGDPSATINSNKSAAWISRGDGEPDKWIEVDTMGSHHTGRLELDLPNASAIQRVTLYGSYLGEPTRLGTYPASKDETAAGGLRLLTRPMGYHRHQAPRLATLRYATRGSGTQSTNLASADFTAMEKGQSIVGHAHGAFYLDEAFDLPLTVLAPGKGWRQVYVIIDGSTVIGGDERDFKDLVKPIYLAAGAHRIEVFFYREHNADGFAIAHKDEDGEIKALPAAWFDVETNAGLAKFLEDKAVIEKTNKGLIATFAEPTRLRKVRWEFNAYEGKSVSVSKLSMVDEKGETILPVTHDFTTGLDNRTLEIAPGDAIEVTYRDQRTSKGDRRTLSAQLSAGFANGDVSLAYELTAGFDQPSTYATAYRFKPGDQLSVIINEPDADVSPKADTIDAIVRTSSGEEIKLTAIEARPRDAIGTEVHSGEFYAILKTSISGETGGDTIRVLPNDTLQAFYLDRENTDPGVPTERASSRIEAARQTKSRVALYRVDPSYEKPKAGPDNVRRLTTPMTEEDLAAEAILVDASHPLVFDVTNAGRALHAESEMLARAVAASELAAAKAEGREPEYRFVRMFPDDGHATTPHAVFAGTFSLIHGGDDPLAAQLPVSEREAEAAKFGPVPVVGADVIHMAVLDANGKPEFTQKFKLATTAVTGLYDSNYEEEDTEVHMGEKFYIQIIDADQDATEDHDEVTVSIKPKSADAPIEIQLTETLPHSGVFSGSIRTAYIGAKNIKVDAPEADGDADSNNIDKAPVEDANALWVDYGDTIEFSYLEPTTAPGIEPGKRTVSGSVLMGDDGTVALFSKRYRDQEIAARVQFRMAECLFEMAKDYRKVGKKDMSANAIDRGRVILDEALQDYPDTRFVTEGLYLLANLQQELAEEAQDRGDEVEANDLFQQAISRFSSIISTWPDSPFAERAQFHKGMCLESIKQYDQAGEEYVRLCYAYPDSQLVADATIRLATHYYNQGRYDVSGRIYENFARRYESHPKAPKVMFMAAQSHMKQAEVWSDPDFQGDERLIGRKITEAVTAEYLIGAKALDYLITDMKDAAGNALRAEAMYWAGVAYRNGGDLKTAYLRLKQVTFEYPDTKYARMARGLLLQDENLERAGETR